MIGAELADRVSPLAGLRPELLFPDGSQDCYACGSAFTACSHSLRDFELPESETSSRRLGEMVAERSQAQGPVKRGSSGRPPGRPPKVQAEPEVQPVGSPSGEAVTDAAAGPPVVEPAPAVAPVGPTPSETPATAVSAPVDAIPAVKPPGPLGSDYGVQTLSPLAAEVRRVPAESIPAGEPTEARDVYDVPAGKMDPKDDPHRPDCVLVNDSSQIFATGAYMTLPGNERMVALTKNVQAAFWVDGMSQPLYRTIAAAGSVLPKPIN